MRCRIFALVTGLALLLGPAVSFSQGQKGPPGGGGRTKSKGGPPGGGAMPDFSSFKGKGKEGFSFPSMEQRGPGSFSRDGGKALFGREGPQPGMTTRSSTPAPLPGIIADGRNRRGEGGSGFGADARFRGGDVNGDGLLSFNELDEVLRNERDRWDQNGDGFIDGPEYAAFYQARLQQWQAERETNRDGSSENGRGGDLDLPLSRRGATRSPAVTEAGRPVVYSGGNLPRELPGWFGQSDRDADGQVSLYEWRQGGQSPNDFRRYDSNDDGFITAEELLRAIWAEQDRGALTADVRVVGPLVTNRAAPSSGGGFGTRGSGPGSRMTGGPSGERGPGGPPGRGGPGGSGNFQGRGGRDRS